MPEMTIKVTKLFKILSDRGLSQSDFIDLIKADLKKRKSSQKCPASWIINAMIQGSNGKSQKAYNPTLKTLRAIKNTLDVPYDDIIDD